MLRPVGLGLLPVAAAACALTGGESGWQAATQREAGIVLRHPPDWAAQSFGRYCMRVGPGLLVSNVRGHRFRNVPIRDGCTNRWLLDGLPDGYVLVDVSLFAFPGPTPEPDTPLPLNLDSFERTGERRLEHALVVRGRRTYTVRVWRGTNVSPEDEEVLARVIRSIDFEIPSGSS